MFIIKCQSCNWSIQTLGNKQEIENKELQEIPNGCANCGKARKFICQKCGQAAKMFRIK
jgi:hypothetical protein